jgi:hypothetical protein
MANETLDVDSFDSTNTDWVESGASPYLNAQDTATITTFTALFDEGLFGFEDTAILDFATITDIRLKLYMMTQDSEVNYVTIDDNLGADFNLFNTANNSWQTIQSANLLTRFASLVDINGYLINIIKKGSSGSVSVNHAYLYITYTVAGNVLRRLLVKIGL